MSQIDKQRELILKSFLVESEEGLARMEQAILELESHPDDAELVQTIFRVVHTMKGNAGILDLQSLLSFAHTSEDLLDAIRNGKLAVNSQLTTLLLSILDVLRGMAGGAAHGKDETSQQASEVVNRITGYLAESGDSGASSASTSEVVSRNGAEFSSGAAPAAQREASRTLRVDIEKLDRLLNLAGEITIARGRVAQMLENKEALNLDEIRAAHSFADTLHLELQETILKTRMVPLGPLFRQYSRTVRDTAKSKGKLAQLLIVGEDVEVDTSVLEHLKDPLLHMIRNAVDHGIETPEERKKFGKRPMGTITVRAAHEGGNVVIDVSDDGAGLDRKKITAVAQQRGIVTDGERLSDSDVYQLIFESGFSTASEVSDLSGRGVGMDVVRRNVQALRGNVFVSSQAGAGSTVHIRLPLTLAIIEGLGVGIGDETFIIPVDQVVECVELPAEENDAARADGILQLRGEPLPFVYLRDHFGFRGARASRQNIVVVQHESTRAGLAVDVLYAATQTVIKPLPMIFKTIPGVSGSAILGNGRVALILDVPALLRSVRAAEAQLV